MKKLILSIFLTALVCFSASAQPYPVGRPVPGYNHPRGQYPYPGGAAGMVPVSYSPFELTASYGLASLVNFAYSIGGIFGVAMSLGTAYTKTRSDGVFSLEGYSSVSPRFSWGGMFCYENFETWTARTNSLGEEVYNSADVRNRKFMSFMPSVKFRYVDDPVLSLYSKLAVGGYVAFGGDDGPDFGGAVQASLIGLEYGARAVRCYAELGFGMKGLASFGLTYRF